MVARFDCKEVNGFLSLPELNRPSIIPTVFRSAVAALVISGCTSSVGQQAVAEPKSAYSSVSKPITSGGTPAVDYNRIAENSASHQVSEDKPDTSEKFAAVCQATGAFKVTPQNDLLMEIRCVKDDIGFAGFRAEDMELRNNSNQNPDIPLTPFVNEAHISIERSRNQITVTLCYRDKKGSPHNIELPKLKGVAYEYSFADYVPDDMLPENDFRTFER